MIYLASHDALTGLINRREFEVRLKRAIRSARAERRQHVLLYLDLDEFKVVNDTCGHLAGDEMLKQITALLRSRVRRSDILARLGGDEFGVLLEDCPLDQARQIAEEMRRTVREFRFCWRDQIFEVGVSIGLVPITADSGDLAQVLSRRRRRLLRGQGQRPQPRPRVRAGRHRGRRALRRDAVDPPHPPAPSRTSRFRLFYQLIQPLGGESSRRATCSARSSSACSTATARSSSRRPSSPRPSATT